MRNGETFDMHDPATIAVGVLANGEPRVALGTKLLVCRLDLDPNLVGPCLLGEARDTGLLPGADLDLSKAAFELLAPLDWGRIKIIWFEMK